ncbi:MAG: hypothetical protein ACP6IY_09220 [Promethearchaeia archaeon]
MVLTTKNDISDFPKKAFQKGDIKKTLEDCEKMLSNRELSKKKDQYLNFLKEILDFCKEKRLLEEEAITLRILGRAYSQFNDHKLSQKYHENSIKIQKKLGRKTDTAEGLVFLAEDLEVSGKYDKCLEALEAAKNIFREMGKLRRAKEIDKEISRLKDFSRQMTEDEYYLQKFHLDF